MCIEKRSPRSPKQFQACDFVISFIILSHSATNITIFARHANTTHSPVSLTLSLSFSLNLVAGFA